MHSTTEQPNYDEEKFAELILFIADRSKDDPGFGAVKLHELLFYSEFGAYRELGRAISGAEFQNLENGPAARRFLPVQNGLLESGFAEVERNKTPVGVQLRLVAKRDPDLSAFSAEELALVQRVIDEHWGKSAKQISLEVHEEPGWIVTSERETIPYSMGLLSRPTPTAEDEEYVRGLIQRGVVQGRRASGVPEGTREGGAD